MHRTVVAALAGLVSAVALAASPATAQTYDRYGYDRYAAYAPQTSYSAYSVDPLTGQALSPYQEEYRPQASAIPRERVAAPGGYGAGTIIINTSERRLYYVVGDGTAIRYGIGVGRPGFTWAGTRSITMKREWPDWRPPSQMLRRRPDLPRYMKGGLDNPLGARAMYLGGTLYRIHGSNEPWTIGQAVSSGCIRMRNEDVIDLYEKVKVGTKVVVLR